MVICTEPKAESVILKLNPNATCVVPESCKDLTQIFELLADPGFLGKGYTRIVLDSYTELANSLAGWIYSHNSANSESPEIGRRISIEEFGPIQQWGIVLVKAIQLSGLPSIVIVRSDSKTVGRVQQIVPAGLGNSPKNLPALLIPTVESRFDHEQNGYIWDSRPDDYSQRCGLPWLPPVFNGTADEFLALIDNGGEGAIEAEHQPEQPETPAQKPRRRAKVQVVTPQPDSQQPVPTHQEVNLHPEPHDAPTASQKETQAETDEPAEPDNDQTIDRQQQSQIWELLDRYRVDPDSFLQWAGSRNLLVTDSPEAGIADIRLDQYQYLLNLFNHDRSRGQFLLHLNNLKKIA